MAQKPIEELPGWGMFTSLKKRVLYHISFSESYAEASRKAGADIKYVTLQKRRDPLFAQAVKIREAVIAEGVGTKPEHVLSAAWERLYTAITGENDEAALAAIKVAAEFAAKTGKVDGGVLRRGARKADPRGGMEDDDSPIWESPLAGGEGNE